jgi:hypothetical protein
MDVTAEQRTEALKQLATLIDMDNVVELGGVNVGLTTCLRCGTALILRRDQAGDAPNNALRLHLDWHASESLRMF